MRKKRKAMLALPIIAAGLGACGDVPTSQESPTSPSEVRAAVTGTALSNLDEAGRFGSLSSQDEGELTGGQAVRLANAYTKRLLPYIRTALETGRGGPIDSRNLAACGRALYAETAMEPLPVIVPLPFRKVYGGYWFVTLCAHGEPQVSLAISAMATDLKVENGDVVFPFLSGNEFFAMGIPTGHTGEYPIAPETAVLIAFQRTGRRVINTPRLVMPLNTQGLPQDARWELSLDGPAQFRKSSGATVATKDIFFSKKLNHSGGARIEFTQPATDQPTDISFQYYTPSYRGEQNKTYEARRTLIAASAHRKSNIPVVFERLTSEER